MIGLKQSWARERVFLNPPYSRLYDWTKKVYNEVLFGKCPLVVYLIPARTDTKAFHEYILPIAKKIIFVKGRLKFGDSKAPAPFPSMIVEFSGLRFPGQEVVIETILNKPEEI